MDIYNKIRAHRGPLGQYADIAEGYYIFPRLEGEIGPRMKFNGKEVIVWSINDYLGLANHPEVRKADADLAKEYGMAYPMGARVMSGNTRIHEEFEQELAEFVGKDAGVLLNFGYQGMVSAIDALVNRKDVIVYDAESHGCIIDGVRLHMGKRFAFEHNNMDSLEKNLQRAEKLVEKTGGGILVISEGVFGMRGDQGDIKGIVALKDKYNFRLFIDDAHGFGVLGKTGAGAGEEQGVQDGVDVYFATFAKSMASIGAFVAGEKDIMRYMKYNMRSQVFAKSLPMPIVLGAKKRLEMLKTMPELKDKLWENTLALQKGLRERGMDIGHTKSCVTPVFMKGTLPETSQLVYDLRENFRIFCSPVIYPIVPKDTVLLRLIPTARHSEKDIADTLHAFEQISMKLRTGVYNQKEYAEMAIM